MPGRPTRDQVAALVDHTLLTPQATAVEVAAVAAEAVALGVYAVCVSPSMVACANTAGTIGFLFLAWRTIAAGNSSAMATA